METNKIEYSKTIEKNQRNQQLFEKVHKIDKPLARMIKKTKKIKSTKYQYQEWKKDITMNPTTKKIIREYFEQSIPINLTTYEWNKVFESYKLLKLTQEEIESLNSLISIK